MPGQRPNKSRKTELVWSKFMGKVPQPVRGKSRKDRQLGCGEAAVTGFARRHARAHAAVGRSLSKTMKTGKRLVYTSIFPKFGSRIFVESAARTRRWANSLTHTNQKALA